MPGTLQDFISQFAGGNTNTAPGTAAPAPGGGAIAQTAAGYLERFLSPHPADQAFDAGTLHTAATEFLGNMPAGQFQQAAQNAFTQATPTQQQGLLGTLLNGLQGRGIDPAALISTLGLGSANPQQMGGVDYARIANYVRTEHPDLIQQTVAQHPWFMSALGNPVAEGALGVVAAKLVGSFLHR